MKPIWLRTTNRHIEIGTVVVFLLLGVVLVLESIRLGPGWGVSGPDAGFFPFVMTALFLLGTLGVLYGSVYRQPDHKPFFEVSQEVEDLLKVGIPIIVVVALIRWLGLYIVSGLYIGFFMAWYGKFRWHWSLFAAIVLPLCLWLLLRQGFNISMPTSVFYRRNILPF
jgi:hypothetical protein